MDDRVRDVSPGDEPESYGRLIANLLGLVASLAVIAALSMSTPSPSRPAPAPIVATVEAEPTIAPVIESPSPPPPKPMPKPRPAPPPLDTEAIARVEAEVDAERAIALARKLVPMRPRSDWPTPPSAPRRSLAPPGTLRSASMIQVPGSRGLQRAADSSRPIATSSSQRSTRWPARPDPRRRPSRTRTRSRVLPRATRSTSRSAATASRSSTWTA